MHIRNINYTHTYITNAQGRELSGCVRADAYNLISIFLHRIIMLSGPGPVLCMIRESHVILKAVLHFRLAV